jgi:putative ABC transport system permease protein
VQGDYERLTGADPARPDQLVASAQFLRAAGARVGDTCRGGGRLRPAAPQYSGRRRARRRGHRALLLHQADQAVAAVPLATLQAMRGAEGRDRASRSWPACADGADVEQVRASIERRVPRVSAISTATALAQVEQRLSYFRQLAFILGAMSLAVGFLLVTTLVTVGVNERIGEIAVLRAIGVSRPHVVQQIVLEGLALSGLGALARARCSAS